MLRMHRDRRLTGRPRIRFKLEYGLGGLFRSLSPVVSACVVHAVALSVHSLSVRRGLGCYYLRDGVGRSNELECVGKGAVRACQFAVIIMSALRRMPSSTSNVNSCCLADSSCSAKGGASSLGLLRKSGLRPNSL